MGSVEFDLSLDMQEVYIQERLRQSRKKEIKMPDDNDYKDYFIKGC